MESLLVEPRECLSHPVLIADPHNSCFECLGQQLMPLRLHHHALSFESCPWWDRNTTTLSLIPARADLRGNWTGSARWNRGYQCYQCSHAFVTLSAMEVLPPEEDDIFSFVSTQTTNKMPAAAPPAPVCALCKTHALLQTKQLLVCCQDDVAGKALS